MKLDFARNVKRNIVANGISSMTRLVFPFLNRTLFLWLLGPEYLGLNGLFGSILGVLMLAELGFGKAVVCSMYELVAKDDRELLCSYLKFYRKVYRWVGVVIFSVGLCLLPFLGRLVHGNVPPDVDLHILYLIHLVNTSASYFLFAYRGVTLGAYHRNDVVTNIGTAISFIQYVATFAILAITRNYYYYIVSTVFFTLLQNILLVKASRRLFPEIEPRGDIPEAHRRKLLSDVKSIFMHKIGGVVLNSADNLVISASLGLVAVAAYGNYYYVITAVGGIVASVYSSMTGGFGNKIYTETKETNFAVFMKMNRLTMIIVAWCAAMVMALYQPFIAIWSRNDPSLVRHILTPVLMTVFFFVIQSRQTLLTFKAAAGLWKQDRWKPIVSAVVNLSLNIALINLLPRGYKLDGVIFSTIAALVSIEMPWESHVVFADFFGKTEARRYWLSQALFAASTLAFCAVAWAAVRLVGYDGFAGLAAKAAVAAVVSTTLVVAVYRRDALAILHKLTGKAR